MFETNEINEMLEYLHERVAALDSRKHYLKEEFYNKKRAEYMAEIVKLNREVD